MPLLSDLLPLFEQVAPHDLTLLGDKVGLQVGDPSQSVSKVVVSLDRGFSAIDFAIGQRAQLLLSHHPLIWDPLKAVTAESGAFRLASKGIAHFAAHTNWDCARGGINDSLAACLEVDVEGECGMSSSEPGAISICRFGSLAAPLPFKEFVDFVDLRLGTKSLGWGAPDRQVCKIAVCGGSADEEWKAAAEKGCDTLVTGEVKQHVALEASEAGFNIVSAGHYATEQPGCAALRSRLADLCPHVEWILFEPSPGTGGRPL